MPVRVVLDLPEAYAARGLWRGLLRLVGGVVFLVGLVASIAAVPLTLLFFLSVLVPLVANGHAEAGVPAGLITWTWAASSAVTIVGVVGGARLVRGHRELVLFLRRFGYTEATKAVTVAVAKTLGRSWRIVTLDDSAIAPVGLPPGTRRLLRAGGVGSASIGGVVNFLFGVTLKLGPLALGGILAILGLAAWRNEDASTYVDFQRHGGPAGLPAPSGGLSWDLHGLFYALVIVAVVAFGIAVLMIPLYLLVLPLMIVFGFVSSVGDAVRKAEEAESGEIPTVFELEKVVTAVAEESRKILAPRLVVLRVASHLWQQTVRRLAALASMPLVDVSEPSENLLWEIEELSRRPGRACVFIGHYERVLPLASASPPNGPFGARLAALLDGEEVLAYTTDRRGARRFARALKARLEQEGDPDGD